jgi:predicted Ser/Thr protein kinase
MAFVKRYKSRKRNPTRTPKRKTPTKRKSPKRTPKKKSPKRTPKRKTPAKRKSPKRTPKRSTQPCSAGKVRNPKTGRCITNRNIRPVGKVGIPDNLKHVVLDCAQLNNWTIDKTKKLGSGQVGSVYLACKDNNCRYAAKMQTIDDGLFLREVEVIETLKGNRYVPAVYATFICGNMGYIIMEKLTPLTPQTYKGTVDSLTSEVAMNLQKMYDTYHVVFVDIHPGNVMVRENGEIVLIDFGWAVKFNTPQDVVTYHPVIRVPGETKTIKELKDIQDFNVYVFKREMKQKWENSSKVTDDLYRVLGVSKTANKSQIEDALFNNALDPKVHPGEYRKFIDAYSILINDEERRKYDAKLARGEA